MYTKYIDGVTVDIVKNDNNVYISDDEIKNYINRGRNSGRVLIRLSLTVISDDEIEVTYEYSATKFDRIRRITGYLVGTLDRFNDAKKSEVNDRTKHDI